MFKIHVLENELVIYAIFSTLFISKSKEMIWRKYLTPMKETTKTKVYFGSFKKICFSVRFFFLIGKILELIGNLKKNNELYK